MQLDHVAGTVHGRISDSITRLRELDCSFERAVRSDHEWLDRESSIHAFEAILLSVDSLALQLDVLDVSGYFDLKQQAMMAHKTQFSEDHMFSKLPREAMIQASGNEYFIQIYPVPGEDLKEEPLADLF